MGADFTIRLVPGGIYLSCIGRRYHRGGSQTNADRIKESNLDRMALCNQQKNNHRLRAELSQVKIPVLVISGDEDKDNGSSLELSKMLRYSTAKLFRKT